MEKEKKQIGFGRILKWLGIVVAAVAIVAVVGFLGFAVYLTITEYKPGDNNPVPMEGKAQYKTIEKKQLTLITWNMGYCGLGQNADFFMDGGTHVMSASKNEVQDNLTAIAEKLQSESPDIVLLQEVDLDSKRSYYINQIEYLKSQLPGYQSMFASNYKVAYVPYPLPTIGKVDSGIATLSNVEAQSAVRIKLPCPFTYPLSLGNLKRGLLVSRYLIAGEEKELVVINLHLEAYDSGEGKIAQTAILKELLEQELNKGNYVIAGGDFNQIFSEEVLDKYPIRSEDLWEPGKIEQEEFDERLQFVEDWSVPSCRSLNESYQDADKDTFQYYMLDGYILSDNLKVTEIKTEDLGFENSDHNPVILKLTMDET